MSTRILDPRAGLPLYHQLADLLRHFPTRIEGLAEEVAERPVRESAPEWPSREASAEMHFAALLARQRWWVSQHAIGRRA